MGKQFFFFPLKIASALWQRASFVLKGVPPVSELVDPASELYPGIKMCCSKQTNHYLHLTLPSMYSKHLLVVSEGTETTILPKPKSSFSSTYTPLICGCTNTSNLAEPEGEYSSDLPNATP